MLAEGMDIKIRGAEALSWARHYHDDATVQILLEHMVATDNATVAVTVSERGKETARRMIEKRMKEKLQRRGRSF